MRVRATAATAALLLAALTACGDGDGGADSKAPAKAKASASKKVDCKDQNLDQGEWMKYCADDAGDGSGTGGDGKGGGEDMKLGDTASTIGSPSPADGGNGGGELEVTPTTVVYQKEAMGSVAANGVYAIITVKDKAPNAVSAAESAPIEGGGWQWLAPDGQALDEGENEASSITPSGFTGGGSIPAGAYKWRTIAFDLTKAQANGGAIMYTDGEGTTFRWKVPATDSGPELAALKKGMEGNY
ncbi:hypothetical protein [Streptomyces sp. NBC_00568]|uniref:hypothetical protein n=1 Tax=Streptomyces sp. NBC_00568 TaxID=2975779 RepID=UPI00224F6C16|nr:hypothetical protein [Streptomyces sp. NBC_00568]MCX4993428.1 hypothetical protein [Streptomyces sp. NBC_00568]